jgi:hypothetical protein
MKRTVLRSASQMRRSSLASYPESWCGKKSENRVNPTRSITLRRNGGGGWIRTTDIGLMRPPLYQLSYAATGEVTTRHRRVGLTADQRIIKKRTDGVKPRLASRENAACARPAHPSAASARRGRLRVLHATLRLVSFAFDILRLIVLRLVIPEAFHHPHQSCRGQRDRAQRH